jgi:glucans biosynthesis protein C
VSGPDYTLPALLDRPGRLGGILYRPAFTVYIFHVHIIGHLALTLRGIHLEQLLKFDLAAITGVPLCFAVSYLVWKIPFMAKIPLYIKKRYL